MKLPILILAAGVIAGGTLQADPYPNWVAPWQDDHKRNGGGGKQEAVIQAIQIQAEEQQREQQAALEKIQRQIAELKEAQEKAEWQAKVERDRRNSQAILDGRLDDVE